MPDLLDRRDELKSEIKALQEELKTIDAEVDAKVGDAREVLFQGWKITQSLVVRPEHVVKESSFMRKYFSRIGRRA